MTFQELLENEQDAFRRTMTVLMLVREAAIEQQDLDAIGGVETTAVALATILDMGGIDGRDALNQAQREAYQWVELARASFIEGEVVSVQ